VALESDVFLFGGVKDDFAAFQNTFFNDLYRYDVRSNTWAPLAAADALPPARAFAAGVAVPQRRWVVVFGGIDAGSRSTAARRSPRRASRSSTTPGALTCTRWPGTT
jgi:N-acetylneuraminic acid mutarotase